MESNNTWEDDYYNRDIQTPPSKKNASMATFLDEVSDHLIEWLSDYREVIIIGDINIHDEDRNDPDKIAYSEMLASFSLKQMVTCITHESGHTLDHIILREGNNLNIEEPIQGYKISDHWMIKTTLGIDKAKKTRKTITMHKNKNLRQIECISELNDIISHSPNIEDMKLVEYYNTKLRELYDKWAPVEMKTVPIKNRPEWLTEEITTLKRQVGQAERRYQKSKNKDHKEIYIDLKNIYRKRLNVERYKYVNEKFKDCDNDPKKLFSTLDEIMGKHKDTILPDGKVDATIVNDMAKCFMNKIRKINDVLKDHNLYSPEHKRVKQELTEFKPIDSIGLRKIILGSKPTTCQTDLIPSAFIKENLDMPLPVLLRIVNHSITTGSFNKLWKLSTIVPLQKKAGSDTSLTNYRLVNNLPFLSKIVEKVILKQLQSHIDEHQLLTSRLCAYRPGYSTESVILKITNDVLLSMDLQCVTPLVAIDLSVAFDTVNHSIMTSVLERRFDITNNALKWFHEYLCDRSIVVEINGTISSKLALPFSVPQGSCASPVLFNLYISTLYQRLQDQGSGSEVIGYADDTSVYKSYPADIAGKESATVKGLEVDIELTKKWMAENRLKMNDTKTEYIVFGNNVQLAKCHHQGIRIGKENILKSNMIRLLGVHLDMQVSLKEHIKMKSAKAAYNLHTIT